VPAGDGSASSLRGAAPEAEVLRQSGRPAFPEHPQAHCRGEGERSRPLPGQRSFRVTYAIDFPGTPIGYQEREVRLTAQNFSEEIAPARTFCLFRDVEGMRRQGFALGGSLENAVWWERTGFSPALSASPTSSSAQDLDLLGDLSLLGHPLRGHVVVFKGDTGCTAPSWTSRPPESRLVDPELGTGRSLRFPPPPAFESQQAAVLPGSPSAVTPHPLPEHSAPRRENLSLRRRFF